jgi:hypothetical protein
MQRRNDSVLLCIVKCLKPEICIEKFSSYHTQHTVSPLKRLTGRCYLGKEFLFIFRFVQNPVTHSVNKIQSSDC